jgi:hypothetical protein
MIFYLGNKVEGLLSESERLVKNKNKRWEYGYCKEIDTVIISKDGTLGDIFNIMGLNIGLPAQPENKAILNNELHSNRQKWERHELPEDLTDKSIAKHSIGLKPEQINSYLESVFDKHEAYIDREFNRRSEGVWCFINGMAVYIPGTYYYGIQWVREEVEYPNFRIIQNELMIFWEACKADSRCYGMQYVKNRRIGASFLAIIELLEAGTIAEDKLLGIVSKKGLDSSKIFRRLIKSFKRLPSFFQPIWDGTNTPKKELVLDEPTKRRKAGEAISEGNGLGTSIGWHNTEINAMDGDAIYRSLLDESGKYPTDVPFSEYWYIVKTSHTKGTRITGKSMVVSTVNPMKKGGSQYLTIWNDSDVNKRDGNGETTSGLYRIFIPAKYCLEGKFDVYGFTIVEDPAKAIKTDEGIYATEGSRTWLKNRAEALKGDPEKVNEFLRQFPETERDAFRDSGNDSEFNLIKLQEQLDHNKFELDDRFNNEDDFLGNNDVERGNFSWKDGIKDTEVIWRPDANGRFFIKNGCHPPKEYRNQYEEKYKNGILAKSPLASHIGSAGVDPYNRSRTVDKRGSYGSYILTTKKEHTCDILPNNTMIVEYIARPKKVELFFEEVLMCSVYYSIPFLAELSNERFLHYIKDRGYRHYSLNNPFKKPSDLSATENEIGGAPQQDGKIRDAQASAVEAYIEDQVGVSMDSSTRKIGEMGDFPFSRTLTQLKDFDVDKRTKFDAFIAFSLALLANQKITTKIIEKPKPISMPFDTYNNSGLISTYAS